MWKRLPRKLQRIVRISLISFACFLAFGWLLSGCSAAPLATLPDVISEEAVQPEPVDSTAEPVEEERAAGEDQAATSLPKSQPSSTATPTATNPSTPTPEPSPLPTGTATQTPTATPIGPCSVRMPGDDLFTVVTLTYGLSRDYAPEDLVPLAKGLPQHVTMGYPSEIREEAFGPLVEMIGDMQKEGLQPQILSAYRSYAAQAIAWDKWNEL